MHSPPSYIGLARAAHSMTLFSRIHAASSSIINFEEKPLAFAHLLYSSGPELKKIKWGKKKVSQKILCNFAFKVSSQEEKEGGGGGAGLGGEKKSE